MPHSATPEHTLLDAGIVVGDDTFYGFWWNCACGTAIDPASSHRSPMWADALDEMRETYRDHRSPNRHRRSRAA